MLSGFNQTKRGSNLHCTVSLVNRLISTDFWFWQVDTKEHKEWILQGNIKWTKRMLRSRGHTFWKLHTSEWNCAAPRKENQIKRSYKPWTLIVHSSSSQPSACSISQNLSYLNQTSLIINILYIIHLPLLLNSIYWNKKYNKKIEPSYFVWTQKQHGTISKWKQ